MIKERRDPICFTDLNGRNLTTVGRNFHGLSTQKFRKLLRKAGAQVDARAGKATELVIVGENTTITSAIRILLALGDDNPARFVQYRVFVNRFLPVLWHIEVSRGVTFGKYLQRRQAENLDPFQ